MKKLIKVFSLLLITLIILTGCTEQAEVEPEIKKIKVGIINQDRIWTESNKAQRYQEQLNQNIKEIQEKYEENIEGLSEEEQANKHQEAYQEINDLRKDLRDKISNDIQTIVKELSEEKELDIVLDNQEVKYGGIDITKEVIKKLD